MAMTAENLLVTSGLPIFFPLDEKATAGLPRPRNPRGGSVRVWARSLSIMQKEAIVLAAASGKAWRLASDEGPYLDGFDAAPCPLSFLSTGMVSSYASELRRLAQERRHALRSIELVQDNFYTMQGSALRGTMVGGALPIELAVNVESVVSDADLRTWVDDALRSAPLSGLLHGVHPSAFSLRRNGVPVALERVRTLPPLEMPDPADWLGGSAVLAAGAAYAAADAEPVVERLDAIDRLEDVAGGAGTSLAETQQRRLHVQVTCRARADGAFEVEQRLFSPLGSTYRFRCDPSGVSAPDPASYMAAGIAFCFMTQLGRYAGIVRRNLAAYDVIQDAHWPARGGSPVEPIETHVYLVTDEDAAFARRTVEMGEQTCFLHALCRTDLAVAAHIHRR